MKLDLSWTNNYSPRAQFFIGMGLGAISLIPVVLILWILFKIFNLE